MNLMSAPSTTNWSNLPQTTPTGYMGSDGISVICAVCVLHYLRLFVALI